MAKQWAFRSRANGDTPFPVAGVYTEAAGQTYKVGDMLKMTTAGSDTTVAICTSGDIPVGWAASDATGTTGAVAYLFPFMEGDLIDIDTDATTAKTVVGVSYDLDVTSGIFRIDIAGTTDKLFNIVDFIDPASTTGGSRVLARVVKCQNTYSV